MNRGRRKMMYAADVQIDFNAGGNDEIMRKIKAILTTPAGTVPFDRDFGNGGLVPKAVIGLA
jgi:hypothetical protein